MRLYGTIEKYEPQPDGTLIITGYASSEALDSEGEVIRAAAMKAALPDYMKFGNIREMHQPIAAGVALEAEVQEDGRTWLRAHIVDEAAVKKVQTKVYKGFSIGGRITERDDTNKSVITGIRLSEISLVDRPANPQAVFEMWKGEALQEDPATSTTPPPAETPSSLESPATFSPHSISTGDQVASPDAIPSAEKTHIPEKTDAAFGVAKSMYDVACLAQLLESLNAIRQSVAWEAANEGDNSPIPEQLRSAVNTLGNILTAMTQEETTELAPRPATTVPITMGVTADTQKAGARNSNQDRTRIQNLHDTAVELGASCGEDSTKAIRSASLQKLTTLLGIHEGDDYEVPLQKLLQEKAALEKRVKELEALPQPPKATLKVIEKGADIGNANTVLEAEPAADDVIGQIKKVYRQGPTIKFI